MRLVFVFNWPGGVIFLPQEHREKNVQCDHREQPKTDHPKQRTEVVKMLCVGVNPFRPKEKRQISAQVADQKENQQNASSGYNGFFSDRREEPSGERVRRSFGGEGGGAHSSALLDGLIVLRIQAAFGAHLIANNFRP
jgi:hypothetical protein